ncbi:MAG: carboxypeptidase-like regulatory domain-containing protein, partial [Nitrospinota bacterium]
MDFSDLPPKGEITNIAINYSIQHPSPGDLDIWITTYYDGSWHDYYLYSSGEITMQNSFSERRSSLPFWDGFPPNLTWYLVVKDNFFGARGLIDFFEVAISYSLPPSEVPAGSLEVTVRNLQGTLVENARVVPFGNTIGALDVFTDRSGKARWDNISQGDYWVEVYYGGTSFGEEYWGDSAIRVENGVVAELGFVRFYPFIKKVILKNAVTETVIPPDEVLPTDTIVRAEISVGNNVFWPLDVQVRVVVDGNQEPPYDTSVNSAIQRVPGHGEDIFFVEFTLNQPGKAFSGFTVQTSLFNGEQIITDTRGWSQAFITAFPPVDANVSLLSFTTDKGGYGFNDPVHGEVRLENNGPDSLTDVHLFVDFVGPQGTFTGGSRSGTFTVQSGDSVTLSLNSLFQLGAGDPSGAYEPRVTLRDSINRPLAEFTTETPGGVVPLIPMGAFPRLKQLIVRSQQHFDPFDSASVQETFREFVHNGFNTLSMSIKLDDGPGEWRFLSQPSPVSGQVLFNSATATGTAKNPLSYD